MFIHLSVDGHLSCFFFMIIMNMSAAHYECCCEHLCTNFCIEMFPWIRITGSYGYCMLSFYRTTKLPSKRAAPFYIPTCNASGFQFLHILPTLLPFFFSHLSKCEVDLICGFDLHFISGIFSYHYFFGKMSI